MNPLGYFRARAVSVGVTPTPVATSGTTDPQVIRSAALFNNGSATVYLGGADVTVAQGYPLPAGERFGVDRVGGLYAIAASGTVELRVLDGA